MIAWASKFFGGIKLWLYAAAATAFAALMAYAAIERREKRSAQDALAANEAKQQAADAQAQLGRVETRDEVHAEIERMPAAPADPQPVATAPDGTSAGELRADWERDEGPGG